VSEIDASTVLRQALLALGVGFLVANLRILFEFLRFLRLRASALVTWPAQKPPYYGVLLALGVVFGFLVFGKIIIQQRPLMSVFGEGMMLVYYAYAFPQSFRIRQGLYEDGIWTESGFVPYAQVGGLSWREGQAITLVIIYRFRNIARLVTVPQANYGEVRRRLRDKIAAHDIHFTLKSFDLGTDERDVV
jgi:hypothetical protein